MVEPRRRAGLVQELVLRLVQSGPRPISGLHVIELIREQGEEIPASLVFRAIRRLVDDGTLRKVVVAGGYAPAGDDRSVTLFCHDCGTLTEIGADAVFEQLHDAARATGFAVSRTIVEVPGICRRCAGLGQPADITRRAAGTAAPPR